MVNKVSQLLSKMDDKQVNTGTTTIGLVCSDGLILAADKRATSGYLISYKKFEK